MDGNLSLILAFLVSISVVLALVIKFKLHPFLSLFIGCLLMGVCSGLDPMAIIKTSCKGFGDTMGDIGIIILLGVARSSTNPGAPAKSPTPCCGCAGGKNPRWP